MKQQGCSWLLETGKIYIDRTTMFTIVDVPVSLVLKQVITAMMIPEQCCNNIVIIAQQHY